MNKVSVTYQKFGEDETYKSVINVGGQDDLPENNFDGAKATAKEGRDLFERRNENTFVLSAFLTD